MAKNKEQHDFDVNVKEGNHFFSYEQTRERILSHSKEDLSSEVMIKRIDSVEIEMRCIIQDSTLTPNEYLTPFTI